MEDWLLIGVGNPLRGDDGIGPMIVRRIADRRLQGVMTVESIPDGADLLSYFSRERSVILVDAVRSGAPSGTVYRWDGRRKPLPPGGHLGSTHAMGIPEAIEMARALGRLPERLWLFGIEAASLETGAGLSREAVRAAPKVIRAIVRMIRSSGSQDSINGVTHGKDRDGCTNGRRSKR